MQVLVALSLCRIQEVRSELAACNLGLKLQGLSCFVKKPLSRNLKQRLLWLARPEEGSDTLVSSVGAF